MNCEEFRQKLDALALLDETAMEEMLGHASNCDECRGELDFMLSIVETMNTMPKTAPPSDFLDTLNERIDKEERFRYSAAVRAARSVRRNWRQYAAAAACLAVAAVIGTNAGSLVNKMHGTDTEPVSPVAAVTPTAAPAAEEVVIAAAQTDETAADSAKAPSEVTETTQTAPTVQTSKNTQTAPTAHNTAPVSASSAPVQTSSYAEPVSAANADIVPAEPASVSAEESTNNIPAADTAPSDTVLAQDTEAEKASVSAGYELAAVTDEHDSSSSGRSKSRSEIAHTNAIAQKRGSEVKSTADNRAIGEIRVTSGDVADTVNIALKYAYDVEYSEDIKENIYYTDSANLRMMLSSFNEMGISYVNYVPAYDGEIRFNLKISG